MLTPEYKVEIHMRNSVRVSGMLTPKGNTSHISDNS